MFTVDVKLLGNGNYKLLTPIHYSTDKYTIYVSEGFVWDGASIPRELWEAVGCPMDFPFSSCIHDALYRSHLLSRKEADKVFHSVLLSTGVNQVKAKAMYLGVRLGGDESYNMAVHMMAHYRHWVVVSPKV